MSRTLNQSISKRLSGFMTPPGTDMVMAKRNKTKYKTGLKNLFSFFTKENYIYYIWEEKMIKKHFIVCLLLAISMVFWTSACKTEDEATSGNGFDITGTWNVVSLVMAFETAGTLQAQPPATFKITFSGTAINGTFTTNKNEVGTYLVIGDAVQWIYSGGTVYTGRFTSETSMDGEYVGAYGVLGTWNATKE